MNSESMIEIIGKRKVDETTRLKYGKIYREQVDFEEKIKKANENIVKYAEMRDDLGEYDKQKLLEFCWQCVLNEQETDVEIILNKFRDCNGEYKMVKEKKSITYTKEKTDELAESHNIMHRKKKYEYSEQEKNIEKKETKIEGKIKKHICKDCKYSINEGDDKCQNCGRIIEWGLPNDNHIKTNEGDIKEKTKNNNRLGFGDYVSFVFIAIIGIISLGLLIGFFILCIEALFFTSPGKINLNNPTNTRRMGKIIFGIIALILIICKK